METIKYIILGIIQGFTEPLPISSSGHLVIIKNIMDLNILKDLNFEIIVNFGSLIAILFIYRERIKILIINFFKYLNGKEKKYYNDFKYCLLIVLGTIPAGLLGFMFKDKIELISDNVKIVGLALLITAFALFMVRKINGKKSDNQITYLDSVKIGLFQAVALLPGISRSGATIVGGLASGLNKKTSFDYSFMLYIPISIATMILGVSDLANTQNLGTLAMPYFLSMIASAIVTYFSVKLFKNLVINNKLIYFVIYCIIVGISVILFL